MKIKEKNGNFYKGKLAKGCKLCMQGAKLVLFVTGLCNRKCFYCPLSEKRKNIDVVYANERFVKSDYDIVEEGERMLALGAGITGGDPLLKFRRTLRYIELLKKEFGNDFHIHLYTANILSKKKLEELYSAGLDEIRFHVNIDFAMIKSIEEAKEIGLSAGAEIPAIPGKESEIVFIAEKLRSIKADFMNINELEASETNYQSIIKNGYEVGEIAVEHSYETAIRALEKINFNAHFCTARYKDSIQLRRRLLRTANNIAAEYEAVSEEGLLVKGIITCDGKRSKNVIPMLKSIKNELVKKLGVKDSMVFINESKNRIETSVEIAEKAAKLLKSRKIKCYIIEQYPTADELEVEVIPLK